MFRVAALFVPAAAVGTLGHELGHWGAAWLMGCAPVLHFASVSPTCPPELSEALRHVSVAAGPLSSILTGCLGMGLLHAWRAGARRLDLTGALWSMLALFWSRPLFNLLAHALTVGLQGEAPERFIRSDESRLSLYLGLGPFTLSVAAAACSLLVCLWVAWRIPQPDRIGWLTGAVIGALLGFALWMTSIGPMLLP